jgi:hypothetical protein
MLLEVSNDLQIVRTMFSLDQDLIEKYHIYAGKGLEACCDKTIEDLKKADESFKLFSIKDEDEIIGFFGKERTNYLNTIFIHPEYRTKEKMGEIWELIKSEFPKVFYTALYKVNERAINFYLRNKGKVIKEMNVNNNLIVLLEIE